MSLLLTFFFYAFSLKKNGYKELYKELINTIFRRDFMQKILANVEISIPPDYILISKVELQQLNREGIIRSLLVYERVKK